MTEAAATAPASAAKTDLTAAEAVKERNPFAGFEPIYNSIARRAFEIFDGNGRIPGRDLENWFEAESQLFHPVHLNINETDRAISAQAELPGFTPEDLEIYLEPQRLAITGTRETTQEQKKGKTICREYQSDQVYRLVDLPAQIDVESVAAVLKNGILELQMPKTKKPQPAGARRIEVKSA